MIDESAAVTAEAVEILDAVVVDEQSPAPQGSPCDACGSPVELGDKFCPACGCPQPTQTVPVAAELVDDAQKHFRCNACGAEVAGHRDPGESALHESGRYTVAAGTHCPWQPLTP